MNLVGESNEARLPKLKLVRIICIFADARIAGFSRDYAKVKIANGPQELGLWVEVVERSFVGISSNEEIASKLRDEDKQYININRHLWWRLNLFGRFL